MLLEELYQHFGTWTRLGRELDLGSTTYQLWKKKGFIPMKSQILIEYKTNGLFKASEEHSKIAQKMY